MLDEIHAKKPITLIITGAADGADRLADLWAASTGIKKVQEKVDGIVWRDIGKVAGRIRNEMMLNKHRPDMVVAFPGGRGTAHMVRIAIERLGEDNVRRVPRED